MLITFGREQVGAFGEKRDSRRLRCSLYAFDLLGIKRVLSSVFTVCSHACQGTAAAILFGHTIWNISTQRDPQHRVGRAETSAHCYNSASDHTLLGFILQS